MCVCSVVCVCVACSVVCVCVCVCVCMCVWCVRMYERYNITAVEFGHGSVFILHYLLLLCTKTCIMHGFQYVVVAIEHST